MVKIKVPVLYFICCMFFLSCGPQGKMHQQEIDIDPYSFTIQKEITVANGAVVSAHPLASKVGSEIMKKGGNAFDAAIATQLALAVVYPNAGNIGGGGFMVARTAAGKLLALDYREMAPSAASRNMYIDKAGIARTDLSQNGHLSSGVPGTVAGLFATLPYAKLPMATLIQPAIDLASEGFVLTAKEAQSLNGLQKDLVKYNSVMPAFARKTGWKAGDTLIQKDLAATLTRIRDKGAAGFYKGTTAALLVAEMQRGKGIISQNDLAQYKAKYREPHVFAYRDYTVVSMPMPSSGGVLLHQMLGMIEDKPLSAYGFHSVEAVQLMTEAERRAYADRAEYMGDADYYPVPVEKITDKTYLQKRMSDYQPGVAGNSKKIQPGLMPAKESEETTHLSVIDKDGNAVSVTTTLNNSYGSKTVVAGAGFFLNDEMDDFSIKPGVPNMYGAVGGEANAIMPGKRMLSSMTPTIVLQQDKPFLVVGTPGGTTIPTSVFQTIVNIIDFHLSTADAVNKPKFHHQWLPDELMIEKGFSETVMEKLKKMGYTLQLRSGIGRTEVIKVLPNGKFEAVADDRGDDAADGF